MKVFADKLGYEQRKFMNLKKNCFHGNQWTSNLALYLKMQPRSQGLSSNRPLGRARRDPGLVWSRVCQILAGYK